MFVSDRLECVDKSGYARHRHQDYDVIYFDPGDLSWEAEDVVIRRVTTAWPLEIRNQARVHLCGSALGFPYPPLSTADEAMTRYPLTAEAVGVRLEDDGQPRYRRAVRAGRYRSP